MSDDNDSNIIAADFGYVYLYKDKETIEATTQAKKRSNKKENSVLNHPWTEDVVEWLG